VIKPVDNLTSSYLLNPIDIRIPHFHNLENVWLSKILEDVEVEAFRLCDNMVHQYLRGVEENRIGVWLDGPFDMHRDWFGGGHGKISESVAK
jgi:hypothetical protein